MSSEGGTSAGGVSGGVTGGVTDSELAEICQQSHMSVMGCNTQLPNIPTSQHYLSPNHVSLIIVSTCLVIPNPVLPIHVYIASFTSPLPPTLSCVPA